MHFPLLCVAISLLFNLHSCQLMSMDTNLIRQKIEAEFANFKTAMQKHSDINKKRADDGWSVGEIAAHIIKSTQVNLGATQKTERHFDQHAVGIRDLFLNFQMKFPSAPMLQPEGRQYSTGELLSMLDRNRDSIIRIIDNDDLTETCVDIQLPVWGTLTKYEWLVLFENHIIRHTKQVNDFNY
jgi:hypothetical protein